MTKVKKIRKALSLFYQISALPVKESDIFNPEYNILLKTAEAVNSFNSLYRFGRKGAKGGPSTHSQQDLYRAMLVFACAGLDAFVKQLIKTKLPDLIKHDINAKKKFAEYVKSGMNKDDKGILKTVALALIEPFPRDVFLSDYIEYLTGESLQSVEELSKVSDASGLETKSIFGKDRRDLLKETFTVRNEIIHEMDLNLSPTSLKKQGYRTRRQRQSPAMEKYTKAILDIAEILFAAYQEKFKEYNIAIEKVVVKGSISSAK